jgi:hypothetical protein
MVPFLAIHAKKGEKWWAQSKRTAPPTNFKNLVLNIFNWYPIVFKKRGKKVAFQKGISKPSWTLRGGSHLGGVLFKSKEKHLKQGEKNFKSWKCFAKLLFTTFDYLQKNLEKIYKRFCKNKTCGAIVVQNVISKKQSMHIL